jgi:Na+-transporting NADH:ubiquinone oxidoreductase subunit NqrD
MEGKQIAIILALLIIPIYVMSVSAIAVDVAKRTNNKSLTASAWTSLVASLVMILVAIAMGVKPELSKNPAVHIGLIILNIILFGTGINAIVISNKLTQADIAKDAKDRLFINSIVVVIITYLLSIGSGLRL